MIADIEEAILAAAQEALGNTLRESGSLPGGWTLDMLKRALQFAPGVYTGFTGLVPDGGFDQFSARFGVYVVTKGARDPQRRHGNQREIGAYEIIEILLSKLPFIELEDAGKIQIKSVENLFRDAMFDLGGTVYGITLEVPGLDFGSIPSPENLDAFIRFAGDATNTENTVLMQTQGELEQPPEPEPEPEETP